MSVLLLVRHAHRDLSDREADNGLSAKGRKQSRRLRKYLKRRLQGPAEAGGLLLVSSPKRRCIETLKPLARTLGLEVELSDALLERGEGETQAALLARVHATLKQGWTKQTVVLCSHGDWLPLALRELCGADAEIKKGGFAEVDDGGRLVRLLEPSDL